MRQGAELVIRREDLGPGSWTLRRPRRRGPRAPRGGSLRFVAAAGALLLGLVAADGGGATTVARAATESAGAPSLTVVLVPGVTGVELRNGGTGRILWGRGSSLLRPRDHGYGLARPHAVEVAGPP